MRKHKNLISLICLMIVISIFLIISFADHECSGDNCSVCYHIRVCEQESEIPVVEIVEIVRQIFDLSLFLTITFTCEKTLEQFSLVNQKIKLTC